MSCCTAKGAPSSSGWQVHTALAKTVTTREVVRVTGFSIMRVEEAQPDVRAEGHRRGGCTELARARTVRTNRPRSVFPSHGWVHARGEESLLVLRSARRVPRVRAGQR